MLLRRMNREGRNSITLLLCEKEVDSGLADLIDLADKGRRGKFLNNLINKIDNINQLMDFAKDG